jgi:hypothetical protein
VYSGPARAKLQLRLSLAEKRQRHAADHALVNSLFEPHFTPQRRAQQPKKSGQFDRVIAPLRAGHLIIDSVIVARLSDKNLGGNFESVRSVQSSRSDRHPWTTDFFKKQAGAALAAKPPSKSRNSAVPTQGTLIRQHEIGFAASSCGYKVTTGTPALRTVASDDVAKFSRHFVSDATA